VGTNSVPVSRAVRNNPSRAWAKTYSRAAAAYGPQAYRVRSRGGSAVQILEGRYSVTLLRFHGDSAGARVLVYDEKLVRLADEARIVSRSSGSSVAKVDHSAFDAFIFPLRRGFERSVAAGA